MQIIIAPVSEFIPGKNRIGIFPTIHHDNQGSLNIRSVGDQLIISIVYDLEIFLAHLAEIESHAGIPKISLHTYGYIGNVHNVYYIVHRNMYAFPSIINHFTTKIEARASPSLYELIIDSTINRPRRFSFTLISVELR